MTTKKIMTAAISAVSRKVMRNVRPMARPILLSFSSLQSYLSTGIDVSSGVVMGTLVAVMVGSSGKGMGDDEGEGGGDEGAGGNEEGIEEEGAGGDEEGTDEGAGGDEEGIEEEGAGAGGDEEE